MEGDVPVWALPDAFPSKPEGADFGYVDPKGNLHPATCAEDLVQKVGGSRDGIDLVWTPDDDQMVVPEQVSVLHKPLRARLKRRAELDCSDGLRMGLVFGVIMLWTLYAAWSNSGGEMSALYSHQLTGLAALLLFMFGLLPLYEGLKMRRHLLKTEASDLVDEVPDAQFDSWLHRQKVPVTYFLLACLLLCGLVQVYLDWGSAEFKESIIQAGLLKTAALNYPQQADGAAWWRMFTAPMLHGNAIHFLMNAGGILYLGRRTETLARWPHLLMVYLGSMWVGGLASFYWIPDKVAVGASGGLMGLLGFMLVFELLHPRLVPKPARRRLLAGVVLMVVIGFLGMSFIDNAAHAGGLLAGMGYAGIVFPASASFRRPETMKRDRVVGIFSGVGIFAAAITAVLKMLA